jgi:ferredoxin
VMKPVTLHVDPIACRAHGLCADEFPEGVELDEWGYPIIPSDPVPAGWVRRARAAAAACPVLALRLRPASPATRDAVMRKPPTLR